MIGRILKAVSARLGAPLCVMVFCLLAMVLPVLRAYLSFWLFVKIFEVGYVRNFLK